MNEQERAPLWEALLAHRARNAGNYHVPGHKGGTGMDEAALPLLHGVYSIDFTEISGLDDLHQPESVIAEAQRLAADCYGADETFFLVGGSTAGNLAAILAVAKPGDLLLVQRNAHKSIINGLMLAGATAVFIEPQIDPNTGITGGIRAEALNEALARFPHAAALILTDPNYYGVGVSLRPLVEIAHRHQVPVLVDAAHGAHYGFHPGLPHSAVESGADIVVHSTHKMLTAMTMGAMLHFQGRRINRNYLTQALTSIQSSSPSYPLLASLDLARRQLAIEGEQLLGQALVTAQYLRVELIKRMPWMHSVTCGVEAGKSENRLEDPLKLVIRDATGTLSGFDLIGELEQENCSAEMADPQHVVLTIGWSTGEAEAERLLAALERISHRRELRKQELQPVEPNIYRNRNNEISSPVPFHFHKSGTAGADQVCKVAISKSVGCVAADQVVPYPPGVPILFPGETITVETAGLLTEWVLAGSRVHGLNNDGTINIRLNGGRS